MAGVAGLPHIIYVNGCDTERGQKNPAESPVNPSDCRTSSLDVLARALIRARPDLPVHLRPLASLLAEQLKNYEGNPAGMRERIVNTMELIEGGRG